MELTIFNKQCLFFIVRRCKTGLLRNVAIGLPFILVVATL